jgi:hypothetical protein
VLARAHNKCGLCEDAHPFKISVGNLYQAKMWSQLFYDSLVPFDTASRASIMRNGYTDPFKSYIGMKKELFRDLKTFASRHSMDIAELRGLDTPRRVTNDLHPIANGQPLSRIMDKIFYSVKPSQGEQRDPEELPSLAAKVA